MTALLEGELLVHTCIRGLQKEFSDGPWRGVCLVCFSEATCCHPGRERGYVSQNGKYLLVRALKTFSSYSSGGSFSELCFLGWEALSYPLHPCSRGEACPPLSESQVTLTSMGSAHVCLKAEFGSFCFRPKRPVCYIM